MSDVVLTRHNRLDLFTRAECEQILETILGFTANGKLVDFKIVPELDTVGFLGEYFHLHLSYECEKNGELHQRRLFVKSIPYQNANMSYFIEKSGIMIKEATLYQTLLNELRKLSKTTWCSQCYFSRKDLFVMANIVDLGYEPIEAAGGYLSENHMKPLLKGLATMHACSIAYEVRNEVNIGEKVKHALFEATVAPHVDWYTAGMRAVLAVALKHPLYQSTEHQIFIREKLSQHFDCVYDMVNPSTKYLNVFCHRDPWGGNVFLSRHRPTEHSAVFVDFQLCRYCPPAIDVLFAVHLNIRPKDRQAIEIKHYRWYYECFSSEMHLLGLPTDDYLSWAQFATTLEEFKLFGALYNCIAATILRLPDGFLTSLKQNRPEDFHRFTNVDRTQAVIELVQTNVEFREYMWECIEDMMRVVLKSERYF